jgi:hypoxanthine phosphoribosyltransferase
VLDPADILASSEQLYSQQQVEAAADRWAAEIEQAVAGTRPVIVGCMVGGCVPLGMLATRLRCPLELDYVHATRYRGGTEGRDVHWLHRPALSLSGRTVIVVDDLLDEGKTLAAIIEDLAAESPRSIQTAVLVTKDVPGRSGLPRADFSALTAPNRWLFGYGMDFHGWLRNAPGIYALPQALTTSPSGELPA